MLNLFYSLQVTAGFHNLFKNVVTIILSSAFVWIYLPKQIAIWKKKLLPSFLRVSVENQILKYGFTTREIIILENDDPGGVFEFSSSSRGPYSIKVIRYLYIS